MKHTRLIAVLVGLAAIAVLTTNASAYYHPTVGRFISRDPGPGAATRPGTATPAPTNRFIPRDPTGTGQYADGMDLYQYSRSNPVNLVDPAGLASGAPTDPGPMPPINIFNLGQWCYDMLDWYEPIRKEIVQIRTSGPLTGAKPEATQKPEQCRCNVDLPTFRVIDNGYRGSKKHVKFEFKVKTDPDGKKRPKNCVLVNWKNGGSWNHDGTTRNAQDYGEVGPRDTKGAWWIDSVDKDPRWWSPRGIRYTAGGGWATDTPGLGSQGLYQMKFRVCIYHEEDVPKAVTGDKKTGGLIRSKAIKCIDWEASILWKKNKITHPAFWHKLSGRN